MTKRATNSDTEVLEVAVELQAQDEARRDAQRGRAAVHEAAEELGVEAYLGRAAEVVEARREEAEARRARRGRIVRLFAGLALAAGIGFAFWQITTPPPPPPWTLAPDRASWVLDVSPGTEAHQTFETRDGHELPVVTVAKALPRADGTWFVNLDHGNVPEFAGHQALIVTLDGSLPTARVYLEAGTDERWRSPPIAIQAAPTEHRLALSSFEHQLKRDGKWHVVSTSAPSHVTIVSVKLGHFVNLPDASGVVRVGAIRVE